MTKYFLRDTPLEEYERLMMEPPRSMRCERVAVTLEPLPQAAKFYDCRGCLAFQRKRCTARHCAWIKERLENHHIGYRILVLQQIRTLRFNELTKRVQNLHIHNRGCSFSSPAHEYRIHKQLQAPGDMGARKITSRWLSTVFLLASSDQLWERYTMGNCWNISYSSQLKKNVGALSLQDYALYQAAKTFQTGNQHITYTDLIDPELVDDSTLRLIVDAMMILRYGDAVLPMRGGDTR
ncbi:hypothetical protein [Oscillibacter sp.]|uniref:hypothetical protein n=1 Tax=Oscillibacter sp. TaxID=1945593 RepID=UPI001B620D0F|nr:hypothetical protein [Oscillibacter sp.]MBP3509291.1 hypothetical protein [Oscillibacter sp.]